MENEIDIFRIVNVMKLYGYDLSEDLASKVWVSISNKAGMSWGPLPKSDRDLVGAILAHSDDIKFCE